MKRSLSNIFMVLVLLAGLSLLLYPTFSDWWNSRHQSRAIAGYSEEIARLDDTETLWENAHDYNARLAADAGRWLPDEEDIAQYNALLNVGGSGIMGYIEIDKIACSLPIYHGTDEAVLQIAVGHIEGSSLPVGGPGTHAVLSGHRGLPSARLFTDLDRLIPGDRFILNILGEAISYEVDQILTVLPEEIDSLEIVPGEDYVTLVTCTPYGVNSHRLLVRGHRVETPPEKTPIIMLADAQLVDKWLVAPFFAVPILLIILMIFLFKTRKRR